MSQQTVIITGGTRGLGFAYAREFLQRGHRVVVSGRSSEAVEAAVTRLEQEAGEGLVAGRVCEVAQLAEVQALWDFALARFGRVDIWLQNAGYARTGVGFIDNDPADIEAMVGANVIGSINAAQVAIAGFRALGRGKLYLTLGGGGASGRIVPGMTVYSSTKRAVKYLANCLIKERKEAKDESILIGTISPGINVTEGMLREMRRLPEPQRQKAWKQLDFIGEHVETTTPWIVEKILTDTRQGNDITWLTSGRLLSRGLAMLFGRKRDVISRYQLEG
jgi:NAD(P)-dependent dehydrogenase (short-subunit alcohol dehydrogenase family)